MTVEALMKIIRGRLKVFIAVMSSILVLFVLLAVAVPANSIVTASFFVIDSRGDRNEAQSTAVYAQERVKSYADLLTGARVAHDASELTQERFSADEVQDSIQSSSQPDSVVINLSVSEGDPADALAVAEAVTRSFTEVVAQLERPSTPNLPPRFELKVVQPPTLEPATPGRRLLIFGGLGFLTGLLLAIAAVVLAERVDRRVRSADEVASLASVPVLATVPNAVPPEEPILHRNSSGRLGESYRQARAALAFTQFNSVSNVLLITSAVPGEGKSTVAINLGTVLAAGGARVLVVEADLRRPTMATYLACHNDVGLANVIAGQVSVESAIQRSQTQGFDVLAAGPHPPNPSELLASERMQDVLRRLANTYEWVLLDTPPLLPVADTRELISKVGNILLVARAHYSERESVRSSAALVKEMKAPVAGYVVNGLHSDTRGYSSYYTSAGRDDVEPGPAHWDTASADITAPANRARILARDNYRS